MVAKEAVADDFFVLSTGIAGDILQKIVDYQGRIAIYGDFSGYTSKPLRDFIYESTTAAPFFFTDKRGGRRFADGAYAGIKRACSFQRKRVGWGQISPPGKAGPVGKGGTLMSEHDKILAGRLFDARGTELRGVKRLAHDLCQKYNQTFEGRRTPGPPCSAGCWAAAARGFIFKGPSISTTASTPRWGATASPTISSWYRTTHRSLSGTTACSAPTSPSSPLPSLIPEERRGMVNEEDGNSAPCYAKPVVIGNDVWVAAGVTICGRRHHRGRGRHRRRQRGAPRRAAPGAGGGQPLPRHPGDHGQGHRCGSAVIRQRDYGRGPVYIRLFVIR